MIGLDRWCGGAQHHTGVQVLAQVDGGIAGVVARCGVLLFVAGVVLFIHYHQGEVAEGEEQGAAGAHHHLVSAGECAEPHLGALAGGET